MRPDRWTPVHLHSLHLFVAMIALGVIAWNGPARALPFTAPSRFDYPTGSGPYGSTSADVNNDGHPDVITANSFDGTVSVLINDGTGIYEPHVDYPTGDAPNSVLAYDLNYDGFQDLFVTNQNSNTTSILFGNGTGQFNTKVDYPSGTQPVRATWGIVNHDNFPDLITVNKGSSNVSVRLGTGGGAFGPAVNYAVGLSPLWVTAQDLNGDIYTDLVTANYNANSISILLANGSGGYLPRTDIALGAQPQTVVLGYFNDDANYDIAISLWSTNRVAVLFGDGLGNFANRINLITGTQPIRVCAGDINLDGATDIAVANSASSTMSVFFGTGQGAFATKVDFVTGSSPYGLAIDDATGDGQPDLSSCNVAANTITIRPGNVPGGFFVGDTLVDMTAMNQDQNPYAVSGGAGKWRIVEICAVWCSPCNAMAAEVRQICDTWANVHPLPFEYVTVLTQGPDGSLSNQQDAAKWRTKYQQNSPVLHTNDKQQNALQSWVGGIDNTIEDAFPQVMIVDPQGKIRERHVGYLSGQELVDKVASYAAIAPAPTLAPPLPPLPPDPPAEPTARWRALATATVEIHYGNASWSGPLGPPVEDNGFHRRFEIVPTSVPGIQDDRAVIGVTAFVDSITGLESFDLLVGTYHVDGVIQLAEPWQVRLVEMSWDDAQPRVLAATPYPVQLTYVTSDADGNNVYGPPSLDPIATYTGTTLAFSPFVLGAIPNIPDSTNMFAIGCVWLKHQFEGQTGVFSHSRDVAPLAAPRPNPANTATSLRWAMVAKGVARMQVLDLGGRLVRTLQDGLAEIGEHASRWDLRDDQGDRVAPGLYYVRFETTGQPTRMTRVVVMH